MLGKEWVEERGKKGGQDGRMEGREERKGEGKRGMAVDKKGLEERFGGRKECELVLATLPAVGVKENG